MDYKELNKHIQQEFPELFTMNEMAELDGGIVVRSDNNDSKFSHFHWGGVHFNLFERIPNNAVELKNRIHFEKEKDKLSTKQLKGLLDLLYKKSTKKAGKFFNNVHEFAVAQWELLNKREVDKEY